MNAWIQRGGATFAAVLAAAVTLPSKASPLPPQRLVYASVSYVSGGIGEGEAQRLQAQGRDYPLTVELLEHATPRDEYTADANVTITDARDGRIVLDAKAEGPFMLVHLPAGNYRVAASLHGRSLPEHRVHLTDGGHAKTTFVFPARVD